MSSSFLATEPIWTRRMADEFWSGPVTPLTFDLLAPPMTEHMVRQPLDRAGLPELAGWPVLHRHASHVYVNAALLAEIVTRIPSALRSSGLLAMLPPEAEARLRATSALAGGIDAVAIVARLLAREPAWAPWQRATAFDAACADVRRRLAGPAPVPASPAAALADLEALRASLGAFLGVVSWGIVFAYVFFHLVAELVARWAPGLEGAGAELTVGLPGVASLEAHADVLALGRAFAAEPGSLHPVFGAGGIRPDDGRSRSTIALDTLLVRHGHRMTGRDLQCPPWRDAPEVVAMLAHRAAERIDPDRQQATAARRLRATATIEAAVGRGLAGPLRLAAFRAALAAAQRYYVVRENMRYHADFFLARMHELCRALGANLVTAGRLAAADDVFFLAHAELGTAPTGGPDLRTVAAARRAAFAADAAATPPPTLGTPPPARGTADPTRTPAAARLAGETGAPGRCRAVARVVRGPDDFDSVESGDVLVAAYADPAWTPILELASGIVLEAGGVLSHGAIVARELGIPAVVNLAGATTAIRSGDTVELDGQAGTVTVVARP